MKIIQFSVVERKTIPRGRLTYDWSKVYEAIENAPTKAIKLVKIARSTVNTAINVYNEAHKSADRMLVVHGSKDGVYLVFEKPDEEKPEK
jgi:hypothetical protein